MKQTSRAKAVPTAARTKAEPRAGARRVAALVTVVDGFEVYRSALRPKHLTQEQISKVLARTD